MDEQPPKPRRDWRSFGKEYVIVVLGVATALAAQQAADWWNWRNRVAEARVVISNELTVLMSFGIERVRFEHCIEQRLDALAVILDEATRKGALPPVPKIGQPPIHTWPDDVWQTTMSSDAATHFPQGQLNPMATIYPFVRQLREKNQDEQLVWANLGTMIGPGRRLDPASDAALRAALSQARYYNRIMALLGDQMARRVDRLGLPSGPGAKRFVDDALHRNLREVDICKPLAGPISAQYGQAQLDDDVNSFRDWQKHPPHIAAPPQGPK